MIGYNAPTLFILKHFRKNENTGKKEECIFGGYMHTPWIDKKGY